MIISIISSTISSNSISIIIIINVSISIIISITITTSIPGSLEMKRSRRRAPEFSALRGGGYICMCIHICIYIYI